MDTTNSDDSSIHNFSFLYVLYNPIFSYYGTDVFKIGMTSNVEKRIACYTTSYIYLY